MLMSRARFDPDFSVRDVSRRGRLERNRHQTGKGRLAEVMVVVESIDHRLSAFSGCVGAEQAIVNRQQIRIVGIGFGYQPRVVDPFCQPGIRNTWML
jgi:hypothetical protein